MPNHTRQTLVFMSSILFRLLCSHISRRMRGQKSMEQAD
jgi:hypothetical protein